MPIRITGSNSGMDIEKLVTDMMRAERLPLDKMKSKQKTLTWQTDLYREVNTKLAALKTTLDGMKLSGDWAKKTASSSNQAAVTASVGAIAGSESHSISVTRLATGATLNSPQDISNHGLLGKDAPGLAIKAGENDQFNVSLGGITKKITLRTLPDGEAYTDETLRQEIQTQLDLTFGANKIKTTLDGGKLSFEAIGNNGEVGGPDASEPQIIFSSAGANTGLTNLGLVDQQSNKINALSFLKNSSFVNGTVIDETEKSFEINGQKITYSGMDSLAGIISKVNNSAAGVTMSYDEVADRIVVNTKETGSSAQINFGNDTGSLLSALQLDTVTPTKGLDAIVTVDGVESYRSSNSFIVGGVTYSIKQTTTEPVTIGVTQDTDSMMDKIKKFVVQYNETVELMNRRLKEAVYKEYSPLTDAQKEEMKSEEIEKWETKAKSGLLRRDTTINSTLTNMRELLSTQVGSVGNEAYNALYKFGISTVPYSADNPFDSGKLQIDEAQLKEAIDKDPNSIIATFSGYPDGIAHQMIKKIDSGISQLIEKAGKSTTLTDDVTTDLGSKINTANRRIKDMDARLLRREEYFYAMFARMDTAIGKSNSTLNWLGQQLG